MTTLEYVQNNYDAALLAFVQHGRQKGPLINTLQRGPSAYNISKLVEKLQGIGFVVPDAVQQQQNTVEPPKEVVQPEPTTSPAVEHTEPLLKDAVMQKMMDEKIGLLKEASFLHAAKLDDDNLPAAEMKDASLRILEIYQKDLPANAAKMNYYVENGNLPEETQPTEEYPALVGVELYRRIETLKKNIARDKANPSRASHVPKWEAELKIRKEQYAAAEQKGA